MTTDADAMVILANSIDLLAQAIEKMADKFSPGGSAASTPSLAGSPSQPGAHAGAPNGPPGGPPHGGGEDTRIKMSKKVFAICAQNSWDIGDIGQRVTGRDIGSDSRAWSKADLAAVLDAFKDWGVG